MEDQESMNVSIVSRYQSIERIGGMVACLLVAGVFICPARADWPQWGGPTRDFVVESVELAKKWPKKGPKEIWSRQLPAGYSGIVTGGGKLYTMYRDGEDDVVIAMNATNGETVFEHRYSAPTYKKQKLDFGKGPNATPLLHDGYLVTIGFTGKMNCLDASTGELVWSHDLVKDFHGKIQEFGYSASPMLFGGNVITLVGGKKNGVVAFNLKDGSVAWKSEPLDISYASPIAINVDGQDQIVFMASTEVIGIDARTAKVEWRWPCENRFKNNCSSPIFGKDNMLWVTTQQDGGTRMLKLARTDGKTSVTELWSDNKIRLFHWNAVWVGDYLYGTTGDTAPTPLVAIEADTGKIAWRKRGFSKAKAVYADGKLILVDEDGQVGLVKVSPKKGKILSKVELLEGVAWTPPTLDGTTLYIRDTKKIKALDVGRN